MSFTRDSVLAAVLESPATFVSVVFATLAGVPADAIANAPPCRWITSLTALHQFTGRQRDGAHPNAALLQGADGNFYGTTADGGAYGKGTVFQILPTGQLTTLYSFSGPDGANPMAALIVGLDGNFYGTTLLGGTNAAGTVFQMLPSGQLTTLYSFSDAPDGGRPWASLIQVPDGSLYGTESGTDYSSAGGGPGAIFKMTPSSGWVCGKFTCEWKNVWSFTTLHSFQAPADPQVPLIQGTDVVEACWQVAPQYGANATTTVPS
jgi:uncharacterized repeat protein (TIGR03803 family)